VSDGYLQETSLEREAIVGKPLFEVLSLQGAGFASQAIESLNLSLQQALETKQAQQISIKRQGLLLEGQKTNYSQNYYSVSHIPLLDGAGQVMCLVHQLENVTGKYKSGNEPEKKELNEPQAVAGLEKERDQLSTFFEQAPVAITILQGQEYVVELANPLVLDIWARTQEEVVGKPLFVAMPEIKNQGLEELLEGVRNSGRPHVGKELPIELDRHGKREKVYFNFVYHPLRNEQDTITGIAVVATDVSEQVVAREKIGGTARQLQVLNEQLEELVVERTQDLQMAQQQAEKQRVELYEMFMQAPAGIALLKGPELIYQMANQSFLEMVGRDSSIIGKPGRQVFPEAIRQGIWELMEEVYRSGKAYVGNEFRALIHMDGKQEAKKSITTLFFSQSTMPMAKRKLY
jgi:PAS domain S-box-containing protein